MIVFTNSNRYTPVNLTDPEEVAARILWCMQSYTTGPTERNIRENWSDPCDRDNALHDLRNVDIARTLAVAFMEKNNDTESTAPGR